MTAFEVLGGIVLGAMLVVSTGMAIGGLLGASGALRMGRCRACGHLITAWSSMAKACPYCRHPRMARVAIPVHLRHHLPGDLVDNTPARRLPV